MSIDWFKTSRGIFDTQVFTDVVVLAELDFGCGSPNHPVGRFGHNPDDKAVVAILDLPCCAPIFVCAGWVDYFVSGRFQSMTCAMCGTRSRRDLWTITPISASS